MRGVTNARITQALSRWLSDRLTVEMVYATFDDELIEIDVRYRPAGSADSRVLRFQRTAG